MLLVVLRPPGAVVPEGASRSLDAALGPRPAESIAHVAEVEVRTRGEPISLSVKLDGVEIAGTKDVPAALQRSTLVPDQPRSVLGLGASRTSAIFTRIKAE